MAELVEICRALTQVEAFPPLQRILLTCSGTLQGTLSAYFNEEVTVQLLHQEEQDWPVIQRSVQLMAGPTVVCTADSEITVTDSNIRKEVLKGTMGIGQVLEVLGVRPSFSLKEAGQDSRRFWRVYTLEGPGVVYRITETFPKSLYK